MKSLWFEHFLYGAKWTSSPMTMTVMRWPVELSSVTVSPLCFWLITVISEMCVVVCRERKYWVSRVVSISPFHSPSYLLCSHLVRLKQDKDLTGSWLWPPAQKIILSDKSRQGPNLAQSSGKLERWPPCLSQPLLRFRHSTNWASSSDHFSRWRVRERRESANRHVNYVHRLYSRDPEKEIEIKYPSWEEGGFFFFAAPHAPLPVSSLNPNL